MRKVIYPSRIVFLSALLAATEAVVLCRSAVADDAADPATQSAQIETVVVTAEKKEENLQKTPISVTVVKGDAVDDTHTANLEALKGALPNVQIGHFTNDSLGAVFSIRGIGTIATDPYAGSAVQVVQDGVPFYFNQISLPAVFDLERVEVLRGPQGTLFGANTTGGVINVITKQPTGEGGGQASVTIGNYNRIDADAAADLPINDVLAARVAVSHHGQDGYVTNVVNGQPLGDQNVTAARGSLKWTPSDDVDITFIGEYDRVRDGAPYVANGAVPGEAVYIAPGSKQPGDVYAQYPSPCVPAGQPCHAPDHYFSGLSAVGDDNNLDVYSATLNADWTSALGKITSVTGYKNYHAYYTVDNDGSSLYLLDENPVTQHGWQFSQEIRDSVDLGSNVQLLAGGFVLVDHYYQLRRPELPLFGLLQTAQEDQSNWSGSVFVQGYWEITDRLRAQAGIRFTHEHTEMTADSLYFDLATETPIPPGPASPTVLPVNGAKSWDNLGWKVGLDYQWTDDLLLYGYYARGFKSGGFSGSIGIPRDIGPFNPEYVDTFEVGLKSNWADNRLRANLSLYYNKYRDLQLSETYFFNGINGETIINAATAKTQGAELELEAVPVRGLVFNAFAAYLDARYTDFPFFDPATGGGFVDLSGRPLNNAPPWTLGGGVTYDIDLGLGVTIISLTDRFTAPNFNGNLNDSPRSYIQAENFFDGSLEWAPSEDAKWSVSLWSRNMLDNHYISSVVDHPGLFALVTYERPREFGATLKYRW